MLVLEMEGPLGQKYIWLLGTKCTPVNRQQGNGEVSPTTTENWILEVDSELQRRTQKPGQFPLQPVGLGRVQPHHAWLLTNRTFN
jgi:hypothetical protein